MTWILSTVIRLLLRAAWPLVRSGLPHLALDVMATLVCGIALVAGYGLLALWPAAVTWPLATVLLALLGAVLRLAASVGLVAVALLMPLVIAADVLTRSSVAREKHSTSAR